MQPPRPSLAHRAEYAAAWCALQLFRRLGPAAASNLGGGIARRIGPLIPVSRTAQRNLAAAMPELDAAQRRRIVAEPCVCRAFADRGLRTIVRAGEARCKFRE